MNLKTNYPDCLYNSHKDLNLGSVQLRYLDLQTPSLITIFELERPAILAHSQLAEIQASLGNAGNDDFAFKAVEIITKEDLQEFGKTLLNQISGLLGQSFEQPKKWLKTYQVKDLLKISDNTLQTLRDNGTIPFTKIGGILYYNYEDINKVLSGEVKSKRIKIK